MTVCREVRDVIARGRCFHEQDIDLRLPEDRKAKADVKASKASESWMFPIAMSLSGDARREGKNAFWSAANPFPKLGIISIDRFGNKTGTTDVKAICTEKSDM